MSHDEGRALRKESAREVADKAAAGIFQRVFADDDVTNALALWRAELRNVQSNLQAGAVMVKLAHHEWITYAEAINFLVERSLSGIERRRVVDWLFEHTEPEWRAETLPPDNNTCDANLLSDLRKLRDEDEPVFDTITSELTDERRANLNTQLNNIT